MMPMLRPLLLFAIAGALAGCASLIGGTEDQKQLALACEVAQCTCLSGTGGLSFSNRESRPVEWRNDGSAFCPAGFSLSRTR